MLPIVFIKSLLQHTQDILFLKQKSTLKVAEAAVDGKGVTAVLERGQVGISELEVAHC